MTPAICMEDVTFRFWQEGKRNILDHVSLSLKEGGVTVLMGASGCGKSTLAAVAAGLYPENGGFLESGRIEIFGRDLKQMGPAQRAPLLSVMFQNPDLQFCMDTLRREMVFCLENLCVPPEQMDAKVSAAAERLHLTAMLDRPMTSLSGGEKQKAMLCCLAVMESRCLLLDEPFANIDPDAVSEIVDLLLQLKAEGRTIIAIDHRLDSWLRAADEVVLLGEGGKTVARMTPEELPQYRDVFHEQGVFYPGENDGQPRTRVKGPAALSFEGVSIPQTAPEKRLFHKAPEPVWLLQKADAAFPKGRMTAILGHSGCGKTTTFLSILKKHPYTGTIRLGEKDIAQMKPRELYSQIGIVFQNPANQFITQNVEEEVLSSLRVSRPGISDEDCKAAAEELLRGYGLWERRRYSPYMLSQGQQRRLAVLSVLSGKQELLFLDEPTYGQDDRSTKAIMAQLRERTRREGLTVVFITHDRQLAYAEADQILLFEDKTLKEVRA